VSDDRPFGFVQFEFAGRLGPEPGRYVVRRFAGDDPQQVLVIGILEPGGAAPGRFSRRARRGGRPAAPEPGAPAVGVTRITVVDVAPLADPDAWLARAASDDGAVRDAARLLNRALAAYRLGAADPSVPEISAARALTVRVGYGPGEAVADGRWTAARGIEPGGRGARRSAFLQPQERLAAVLGGHDVALACEELALRARQDLDQGREREAALVLEAALRVAVAELAGWSRAAGMAGRLQALARHREALAPVAEAAVQGGLDAGQRATAEDALKTLEAALRARLADQRP
jgi:hypothetical protein